MHEKRYYFISCAYLRSAGSSGHCVGPSVRVSVPIGVPFGLIADLSVRSVPVAFVHSSADWHLESAVFDLAFAARSSSVPRV